LSLIDAVMARRPALDQPTRWQNVEKAITTAARADAAIRERDEARQERDQYKQALGAGRLRAAINSRDEPTQIDYLEAALDAKDQRIADLTSENDEARQRAERAEADAAELHRVLEQTVTVPEYDCPGDTPELCGWSCMLCRGNDEHKYDCVIAKDNPGQPLLDELARLREACEKPSNDPNGRGWASLVDGLDIITKADKEVAAARFEHWKAWAAIRLAQLRAALATKEPNQPG
jgi:hypothetical protein